MVCMVQYDMVWEIEMAGEFEIAKLTNLGWFLSRGPMVGEVGVVGLVHHLAAHALTTNTTTNNLLTLFSPLSNTNSLCPPPLSVYHPFHPSMYPSTPARCQDSCTVTLSSYVDYFIPVVLSSPKGAGSGHQSEFVKRVWCRFSCSSQQHPLASSAGWPGHSKGIVSLPASRRSVTVAGGAG